MAVAPGATTTVAAVLGSPVRHSRSPALMNAAFAAAGLDWLFVAFDVGEAEASDAVRGVRSLKLGGASVTMPLKTVMVDLVDELEPEAAVLRAVNCLSWRDGALVGASTDGPGLVAALREAGVDTSGRRAVVVGAGGAARAVVLALAGDGIAEVTVVNRTAAKAEDAAALAGALGRVGPLETIADADLVVNATSIGMAGTPAAGETPVRPELLRAGQVVVDLVYHPMRTPLLAAAEAAGATAVGGLGMLVHQAALAFERWTGVSAPIDAMRAAAASA
jgi:shikimate dehydrogenase